jgi:phosphotriesterase-related protein
MSIHTVLGPVSGDELGVTSMHEHLLIDITGRLVEPESPPPHGDEVCMGNLGFLRWNNQGLRDNLLVDDADLVIRELTRFKAAGGTSVVDMTNIGLGRRVSELPAIAEATGVNILIGCGWYVDVTHPPGLASATIEELTEILIGELTNGVEDTGVRPAMIGEIGTSAPVTDGEWKVLAAAARAAAATGSAINVHVEPAGEHGVEIVDLLLTEGASPDRIVLSHMDERINLDYHLALTDRGVVLEMDTFGQESYWEFPHKDPTDTERCEHLARLLDRGLESQVVLGCDVYTKMTHVEYGGMGYEHLPGRISKLLEQHFGITPAQLHTMLVDNPRRILDRPVR